MRVLVFSLLFFGLWACQPSVDQSLNVSTPHLILDEVLACQHASGLRAKFGSEHLLFNQSVIFGSDTLKAGLLYPNSDSTLYLFFHAEQLVDVGVQGRLGPWRSEAGLYLGMPLLEVEKINAKSFTMAGFDWAQGGMVVSWEQGRLAGKQGQHLAKFEPLDDAHGGLSPAAFKALCGPMEFDTRHPDIRRLNPVLVQLSLVKHFKPSVSEGKSMTQKVQEGMGRR